MINRNQQKGQGLIEALIAFVIIAISVVALIRFQSGLAFRDSLAQQQSDATLLATAKIESLRDFHVLAPQSPYIAYQSMASGTSSSIGTSATFTIAWTVTTTASPSYKTIDVIVSWLDRRAVARSIRLVTIVAGIEPSFSATVMY